MSSMTSTTGAGFGQVEPFEIPLYIPLRRVAL
jgi:hypothetical protein